MNTIDHGRRGYSLPDSGGHTPLFKTHVTLRMSHWSDGVNAMYVQYSSTLVFWALTMKLNNIHSWNQPRYVLTDDIVKEYFSELDEILPDFVICEDPEERVPALKGQRLQLDSLPPLLMCLIKCYKQDIKQGTRTKICSRFEFPLVSKNDSIPFIAYLFSTNLSLLL